ncbi:GNAT family N-acetyltransferase [Bacillus pseudomycoides]|uniref:GNAT family N-acetyltransferase n=1 Tax=Bacillus pseudomycoides TaxID=64104 RepID=UPI000BEDFEDD|nr:GNAT family N-acetyltransferase [Bacillus pseudomycoides]PDZ09898.1 GNAT family N-acetyltransferase [Bacillus pseudomycoides]
MKSISISLETEKNKNLDKIEKLFLDCRLDLENQNIYQWNDSYPNRAYFTEKIENRELYVLKNKTELIGVFVLDEWQPIEWSNIQWSYNEGAYLVIHSFCIHPDQQSNGYGKVVLDFCEGLAIQRKYTGIRLDVFSKNDFSQKFYEKNGYEKKGEVIFKSKPVNNQIYFCFEKIVTHNFPLKIGEV